MEYMDAMIRHFGMISPEEQEKICSATVAVAGVGGIGSLASLLCAKAGFGRLIVCDHDQYEIANIVEQNFANYEVVGRDKSRVAKEELEKHNKFCQVEAIQKEIRTQEDANMLAAEADFIISGVDNVISRLLISRAAVQRGIPLILPGCIGWNIFHSIYMPDVFPYENVYAGIAGVKWGETVTLDLSDADTVRTLEADWNIFIICLGNFRKSFVIQLLRKEVNYYSHMACPAYFAASLAINNLIKLITGKGEIVVGPDIFAFDMLNNKPIDVRSYDDTIHRRMRKAYLEDGVEATLAIYQEHFGSDSSATCD